MPVTPVGSAASVFGAEKVSKSPEQQLNEYRSEREELKKQLSYDDSPNLRNKLDTLDKRIENLEKRTKGKEECETCKNRKYQDGSDDPGVSFKTPSNIAPEEAAARVRGHENEHVYRNRAKAEREGKEIVSQTVTLKTSVCPECGTPYVSGGQTDTVTRTKQDKRFSVGLPDDSEITGKYLNVSA
ncbi:MAG: hypothetical protein Q4D76_07790 [Oscillospiraceae bacterium]|nr:hypothetical protein [Oscillospiraceae bacterium]